MLRRAARVLRWLLLTLGVLLLAVTPASFQYVAGVEFRASNFECYLIAKDGALWFAFIGSERMPWDPKVRGLFDRNPYVEYSRAFLPRNDVEPYLGIRQLTCPLWFLSVLCLVWPVTSFIFARKHKRGFPVEPKGGGESVSTPVSSS